jgi:hypothetical protein
MFYDTYPWAKEHDFRHKILELELDEDSSTENKVEEG